MLSEKLIHDSFLMKETEMMNEYDILNFQNNLQFYKEGTEEMIASVLNTRGDMYCEMIDQTMEHLRESTTDIKELVNFFEGVYNSPTLDEIPITTKVYNLSAIEKIRPQYLEQITNDIGLNIDKYLAGKISKHEIENTYLSDNYLINCKKNIVRTSIPYNLNAKELAKYDVGTICEINREFISTTVLPFLRNVPQYMKELENTSINVLASIRQSFDNTRVYITVIDKMLNDGKINIDDYRFLNKYLYKSIRLFMQVASYLSFIMIKKITIVSGSINRYKELHVKILNYFPEGDNLLHESVIDGTFDDFDMGALVHDILQDNNSLFRSVLRNIVNRERADIAFSMGPKANDDDHSMIDVTIGDYDYSIAPYHNALNIFKVIETGFNIIESNLKDPYVAFVDILEKSGFNVDISERFSSIINQISDTSQYDSMIANNKDNSLRKQIYFMMLHELSDAETHMDEIVDQIRKTYTVYESLENKVNNGDTLEIKNEMNIDELKVFLRTFDADYRQLILTVMREFIARIRSLDHSIKEIDDDVFANIDVDPALSLEEAEFDFYDFVTESMMEINDAINELIFTESLKEYNSVRTFYETGVRVVYEADEVQTGEKKTAGSAIKNIIESIKTFFTKSKEMLQNIVTKQSGNVEWLQKNRDALINRNFSGVTVNVVPYEKYVTTDEINQNIDTLVNNINALNKDNIKKYNSIKSLNGYLFGFMSNGMGLTEDISEVTNRYYKVKQAKLEVMPYKGGQAKALMPIMVDYCIEYYTSFNKDLNTRLDNLNKAMEAKLNALEQVMTESVMYEADGQQVQQQAQTVTSTTTTQPKANTKPTVNVDKQTQVRDGNGKKVQTNSSLDIVKWMSRSVQQYSAGVLNCTRDRNYEYLKIIKALTPANVKKADNAAETSSQTTTDNTQQTQQ